MYVHTHNQHNNNSNNKTTNDNNDNNNTNTKVGPDRVEFTLFSKVWLRESSFADALSANWRAIMHCTSHARYWRLQSNSSPYVWEQSKHISKSIAMPP